MNRPLLNVMLYLLPGLLLFANSLFAGESPSATAVSKAASPAPVARAAPAADRLDLDATVVTGNRELPKVLYIVPWKKAELGDLPEQPFNTLLDEALQPVDRDEFRREVSYYSKLTSGAAHTDKAAPDRAAEKPGKN